MRDWPRAPLAHEALNWCATLVSWMTRGGTALGLHGRARLARSLIRIRLLLQCSLCHQLRASAQGAEGSYKPFAVDDCFKPGSLPGTPTKVSWPVSSIVERTVDNREVEGAEPSPATNMGLKSKSEISLLQRDVRGAVPCRPTKIRPPKGC